MREDCPAAQSNEMSALTLLALGGVRPKDAWVEARRPSVTVSKGILESLNFSLRHEVARLIVWHVIRTRPVVPSAVS
jgi:hypothetical protein